MPQKFIVLALVMLTLSACQSAFHIKPESLPKKIHENSAIKLQTADGSSYLLSDIVQEHQATVVIFWQSTCPCVRRYQTRVNNLYERFGQDGVAFMYVSSNTSEPFEVVMAEYNKRALSLPLLRDEHGTLAKTLGVRGTPSAAVINHAGDVVYLGWIDNERGENESGRKAYLEDALTDVINHRPVKTPTSPMFGCEIK